MTNADFSPSLPRFCPNCGGHLSERLLETEERPRLVCDQCQRILYLNPKVVAGAIIERGGRLLLLRRSIEPRSGTWTFPAGYMEVDETAEEAAAREVEEEVGLKVKPGPLVGVYSRPAPETPGLLVVVFQGLRPKGRVKIGHEVLAARWFPLHAIPWDELSFPTTRWALDDWLRARGDTRRRPQRAARPRPPRRGG
ncbi:MAG: NUDIX hydrolase [Dehalococcoidia bacterium]